MYRVLRFPAVALRSITVYIGESLDCLAASVQVFLFRVDRIGLPDAGRYNYLMSGLANLLPIFPPFGPLPRFRLHLNGPLLTSSFLPAEPEFDFGAYF